MEIRRVLRGGRAATLLALAAAGLTCPAAALAEPTPVPVLTGSTDQITPAAAGTTLVWARNGLNDRGPYDVYVRVGGKVIQVNSPITQAFGGGISGDTVVYQRVFKGQSDLRYYNIATGTYSAPSAWNSGAWEWSPTVSGTHVLFGRASGSGSSAVERGELGDRSTAGVTELVSLSGTYARVFPGQVNGNYAVWSQCINVTVLCNVWMYDIAAGTTTLIRNTFSGGKYQYAPSVTADGTVYFVHSGSSCGAWQLVKKPLGAPAAVMLTFAHGIDVNSTYVDDTGGTPVVYYSRYACAGNRQGDVYRVAG